MGRSCKHKQFFRLRASIDVRTVGAERSKYYWLTESIKYIDFNKGILLIEAVEICATLPGFLSYSDIKEMDWNEYEKIIEIVKEKRKDNAR